MAVRKVDCCLLSVYLMADASPTFVRAVAVYGLTMGLKSLVLQLLLVPQMRMCFRKLKFIYFY